MNILLNLQRELNVPKSLFNKFGNYKYRSCESILEALKPLLVKYETTILITDNIEFIGNRFYVKATVKLIKDKELIAESTAYAREPEGKKGMDESQITGATSSYARKYALNGMFAIDDNKDPDTDEHYQQTNNKTTQQQLTIKQQINNVLNLPNVPESDRNKWISDFRSNVKVADENTLNILTAMYGHK